MAHRPAVFVFDALDTLLGTEPLARHLVDAGLPAEALDLWTARILRDGFALAATGTYHPFHEVAARALAEVLDYHGLDRDVATVEKIMVGFDELAPRPDVESALERISDAGLRAVVLTNLEAGTVRRALQRADLQSHLQQIFDSEQIGAWKPRPESYAHVARALDVERERLALVASHAWDVHGAKRAGLAAGFVDRAGTGYPSTMQGPDVVGPDLLAVVDGLLDLPYPRRRARSEDVGPASPGAPPG